MLEGFTEMDILADRGFIPGMSKVCDILISLPSPIGKSHRSTDRDHFFNAFPCFFFYNMILILFLGGKRKYC